MVRLDGGIQLHVLHSSKEAGLSAVDLSEKGCEHRGPSHAIVDTSTAQNLRMSTVDAGKVTMTNRMAQTRNRNMSTRGDHERRARLRMFYHGGTPQK